MKAILKRVVSFASREALLGSLIGKMARNLALFSLTLLGLASCSVGPNYHPPRTEVGAAFANGTATNFAPAQAAADWWRGFEDPMLNRLVAEAMATNQDVQIATARVREARALRLGAVFDELPVPEATAGYNKTLSSKDSIPFVIPRSQRQIQLFTAGFDATWELDVFGRVRREIEAAGADLGASRATLQDVLVTVISEVARNYFELRGQQNELAVAEKNAANERQTLDLTVAKFQAGRATELDTARARAQLEATLATIPPLEADAKHSIYRLGVLTGRQPTELEAELTPPAPIPALPVLVNIGSPAELLRRRPDIRAAERQLASATALIGVETSSLFPRVTFNGNLGFSATHLSGLGGSGSDFYSFGPAISWAALDYGHVRARLQAAHARADAQLAFYQKTVLTALEETEDALVDFGREEARRGHLQESVSAARQAMELARQRYEGGVSDFLPVLDAERTLIEVEAQLAQSQTRSATDLVAVYKALGGGWQIAE